MFYVQLLRQSKYGPFKLKFFISYTIRRALKSLYHWLLGKSPTRGDEVTTPKPHVEFHLLVQHGVEGIAQLRWPGVGIRIDAEHLAHLEYGALFL